MKKQLELMGLQELLDGFELEGELDVPAPVDGNMHCLVDTFYVVSPAEDTGNGAGENTAWWKSMMVTEYVVEVAHSSDDDDIQVRVNENSFRFTELQEEMRDDLMHLLMSEEGQEQRKMLGVEAVAGPGERIEDT